MVTESRNEKEQRIFSKKTPHQMLVERIYGQKIEEVIIDTLVKSQGYINIVASAITEKCKLNISHSTLTRWIDQLQLREEVDRVRAGFGRATSNNLIESGLFSSERMMRAIDNGLCTACDKSFEELLTPIKMTNVTKVKSSYNMKKGDLSLAIHDRKGIGHFFVLNREIVKELIDEL